MESEYLWSRWSKTLNGTTYYLEDEMVESWPLVNSPIAIIGIVITYLLLVTKIGPKFMEDKKPFDINSLMIFYNIFQVLFNIFILCLFFTNPRALTYIYNHACFPTDKRTNPLRLDFVSGMRWYFIAKLADLIDTVFMVLKKKNSHITYLHLFHHSTMVISVWISLKYIRNEIGVILGILNVGVHVIMYSYYLLSAMGPSVQQRINKWKSFVTKIQIGQFVIALMVLGNLVWQGCSIHPYYALLWFTNVFIFLVLFINFYIKTYTTKKKAQ